MAKTVYSTVVDVTVAETVYSTVVDVTVAKSVYTTVVDVTVVETVYSTVADVTVAKTAYSTVETVQHSMALLSHGRKESSLTKYYRIGSKLSGHYTIHLIEIN